MDLNQANDKKIAGTNDYFAIDEQASLLEVRNKLEYWGLLKRKVEHGLEAYLGPFTASLITASKDKGGVSKDEKIACAITLRDKDAEYVNYIDFFLDSCEKLTKIEKETLYSYYVLDIKLNKISTNATRTRMSAEKKLICVLPGCFITKKLTFEE